MHTITHTFAYTSSSFPEPSTAVPVLSSPGPHRHVPAEQQQPVPGVLQEPPEGVLTERPASVAVHRRPHAVPLHKGQHLRNNNVTSLFPSAWEYTQNIHACLVDASPDVVISWWLMHNNFSNNVRMKSHTSTLEVKYVCHLIWKCA